MAQFPPNDPSRGSRLSPTDDEGTVWYRGMAQLQQSFAHIWNNFQEHEARLNALSAACPGFSRDARRRRVPTSRSRFPPTIVRGRAGVLT